MPKDAIDEEWMANFRKQFCRPRAAHAERNGGDPLVTLVITVIVLCIVAVICVTIEWFKNPDRVLAWIGQI